MAQTESPIHRQIAKIISAMQEAGLWSDTPPGWMSSPATGTVLNIWQWLQYIELPRRQNGGSQNPQYLAPHLKQQIQDDGAYQNILQLVIELDAITSTYSSNKRTSI